MAQHRNKFKRKKHKEPDGPPEVVTAKPPRPIEQMLIDAGEEMSGGTIVCTSIGAAQAAAAIAQQHPEARVVCNFFDIFLADSARRVQGTIPNLDVTCIANFVAEPVDTFALALKSAGEGELTREMLQTAMLHLTPGGRIFAATDNVRDHWLHTQLRGMFDKVTNRDLGKKAGRLYIASRPKPVKREKTHEFWFAFRDAERLIHVCSRPGVFSHRRLDLGARALIESLTVDDGPHAGNAVRDGSRVLDIGCGTGAVALACALRATDVHVHAMDANIRAIDCTKRSAEKNGITGLTTQLEAAGHVADPGTYDLVVANPPYYSHFRISEIFVQAALQAVKPGGRVHFVTKEPIWFSDRFVELFDDVSIREIRGYYVVKATGRQPDAD